MRQTILQMEAYGASVHRTIGTRVIYSTATAEYVTIDAGCLDKSLQMAFDTAVVAHSRLNAEPSARVEGGKCGAAEAPH